MRKAISHYLCCNMLRLTFCRIFIKPVTKWTVVCYTETMFIHIYKKWYQVSDTYAIECTLFLGIPRNYQKRDTTPGADPGILVRGVDIFFFKCMGFGEAPGSSWILVILGVKFNHIVGHHRWSYKQKCNICYQWNVIWVHLSVFVGFEPPLHTAIFITCYVPCANRCFSFSFKK